MKKTPFYLIIIFIINIFSSCTDNDIRISGPVGGSQTYLLASGQNSQANAGETLTITAPGVVHFDATGFVSSQGTEFVRLRHRFHFGDLGISGSGSWDYPYSIEASERLKNEWVGMGVTAHMYEEPGSFPVQHRVRDINGDEMDSTILTVVVQDPDVVYSNSTVCLFRGSGIGQGTSLGGYTKYNVDNGWPVWESDTRYLLRASEDFLAIGDLSLDGGLHRIQIGKYGNGADPIVSTIRTGYPSPNSATETDWPTAITFYDINAERLVHRNITNSHSFIRGQIRNSTYIGSAIGWWLTNSTSEVVAAYTHNKFTAYVDTHIVTNANDQVSTVFGTGYAPIFLGVRIGSPTIGRQEHTVRMFGSYKGVYQYTQFDPPHNDGGRVNIRIQSNGTVPLNPNTFTGDEWSQFNSLERCNFIGGANVPFGTWVAPESSDFPQNIRDTGIFNNVFSDWSSGTEIALGGQDLAFGNNSFNRAPVIITGFKINGGIPDGPYFTDINLTDPTPF